MKEKARLLHSVVEKTIRVLKLDIKLLDTLFEDTINNTITPYNCDIFISYSNSEKWCSIYSNNINAWDYIKIFIVLGDIIFHSYKAGLSLYFGNTLDEYYFLSAVPNMNNVLEMSDEEFELLLRLS